MKVYNFMDGCPTMSALIAIRMTTDKTTRDSYATVAERWPFYPDIGVFDENTHA